MKIIEPYFEFIDEPDPLKKIEICGRVCYKSESKIGDGSAEGFVKGLIKRGHESVLEHADYIVKTSKAEYDDYSSVVLQLKEYGINPMLRTTVDDDTNSYIISGNVRMWRDFMRSVYKVMIIAAPPFLRLFRDNILFDDVMPKTAYLFTNAEFITKEELLKGLETDVHKTQTVKFIVDRGISHEIVRHRTASFSQESTRYCNYSGGITFIKPRFFDGLNFVNWEKAVEFAEYTYNLMIAKGAKPQEARTVLPHSTKTEVIMTANVECWKHFFDLRTAAGAHPQMKEIAIPLKAAFEERGIM